MVGHRPLEASILGSNPSPAADSTRFATSSNTLYIGQTNNLKKRLREHKSKTSKSAKYVRFFNSFELIYTEEFATRQEVMKREWQLKQWSRRKKEALIRGDKIALKKL